MPIEAVGFVLGKRSVFDWMESQVSCSVWPGCEQWLDHATYQGASILKKSAVIVRSTTRERFWLCHQTYAIR